MAHRIFSKDSKVEVEYSWRSGNQWCKLQAHAAGAPRLPSEGSLEQFSPEHYWGYSCQSDGGTVEYHVSHVLWKVWSANKAEFSGDTRDLYGEELSQLLKKDPASAFIADGSPVKVLRGCALSSLASPVRIC